MIGTQEQPNFAARIGLPTFDEQCEKLVRIIQLLDLSPLHTIASEVFASRFLLLLDAIEEFFRHEEALLNSYAIPTKIRCLHIADHKRIREMLNDIYMNSVGKKNQTAIDVYRAIRFEIDQHVLNFSFDVGHYIPVRMH